MSEIERLRQQAKKLRQSVNNKISRTKRKTGAELSGSEFDPRRESGAEDRYNRRQLQSYISEMKYFMRRGNQFVGLAGGVPATRGEWVGYKSVEAEVRAAAASHEASIADLPIPSLGGSIGENLAMRPSKNSKRVADGAVVAGPYGYFDRQPFQIKSREALATLRQNLLNQLKPDYFTKTLNAGRENLKKALITIGENEFAQQIDTLSDYQFDALWFGNPAAIEAVFLKYGIMKEQAAGTRKERWQDRVVDNAVDDFGQFLSDAQSLPRERPQT